MELPIHREWMRLALAEAEQAPATRDVPVGAVVVNGNGVVIAASRNEREPHRPGVGRLLGTESHGGIMAYGAR